MGRLCSKRARKSKRDPSDHDGAHEGDFDENDEEGMVFAEWQTNKLAPGSKNKKGIICRVVNIRGLLR